MSGIIDIVCNLYTPQTVAEGRTGLDDAFMDQIRMPEDMRGGVEIADYVARMDRAGIERSLLVAVRAGQIGLPESFEVPYKYVREVCEKHPARFSGLAGIDPTRGMAGLKELEYAVKELGFVGAHWYPHWFAMPPDAARMYPYYAKCCELDIPIMMQVGQNLIYSRSTAPAFGGPADRAGPGGGRFSRSEADRHSHRRAVDRGDDRHVLEARERLYRRRRLRTALLAGALRPLPELIRDATR